MVRFQSTAVTTMRHCVLLCTSPLQVLCTRSALDVLTQRDGKQRKLTVLVVHPLLNKKAVSMIQNICEDLHCSFVDDYSKTYDNVVQKGYRGISEANKKSPNSLARGKLLYTRYKKYHAQLREQIKKNVGKIDEVFCREALKYYDVFTLYALTDSAKLFCVEDGIGDFIKPSWKYRHASVYEIRHRLKRNIKLFGKYVVSGIITKDWVLSRRIYRNINVTWDEEFSVFANDSKTLISREFLRNVRRIQRTIEQPESKKVIIFGSILHGSRYGIDVSQEVEMYNAEILKIMERHGINHEQVWYKPHPRAARDNWEVKAQNLNCRMYEYEDLSLAESELCNPHLVAVYSIGSTALLYASDVFGVQSYLIDLSRQKGMHPSDHKKYKYVADQFGISSEPPAVSLDF